MNDDRFKHYRRGEHQAKQEQLRIKEEIQKHEDDLEKGREIRRLLNLINKEEPE